MSVDWEAILTVDNEIVAKEFISYGIRSANDKLNIRGYSLPFEGTQQRFSGLIKLLSKHLINYVFPEKDREESEWPDARDKFGNNDPQSDGKLGEMLLYILVEHFLKTPMMAYKLKDLSNPNDQVKGADGVFVGNYKGSKALLIGESKIHKDLSKAITSAINSLQRFHTEEGAYQHEIFISRKYPEERQLSPDALQGALDIINGAVDRVLVHPVFISYDWNTIGGISAEACSKEDAECALAKSIDSEVKKWEGSLLSLKAAHPKPFNVFLDFFFLPVEDTLSMRKHFYKKLHNSEYVTKKDIERIRAESKMTKKSLK